MPNQSTPEIDRLLSLAVDLDDPYGYDPAHDERRQIPHDDYAVPYRVAEQAVLDAVERVQSSVDELVAEKHELAAELDEMTKRAQSAWQLAEDRLDAVERRTAEIVEALRGTDGLGWLEDDAYADWIERSFPRGGS